MNASDFATTTTTANNTLIGWSVSELRRERDSAYRANDNARGARFGEELANRLLEQYRRENA